MQLRIICTEGGGYERKVSGRLIRLGRDAACEVPFDPTQFPKVSGLHAQIEHTPGGTFLTQKSQSNSTLVNDIPIEGTVPLRRGDRIRLGFTGPEIQVVALSEPEPVWEPEGNVLKPTMAIVITCSGCKTIFTLGDDRAGAFFNCPKCEILLAVPPLLPRPVHPATPSGSAKPSATPGPKTKVIEPPIEFLCPVCRSHLRTVVQTAGTDIRCSKCNQLVIVPTLRDRAREGILLEREPEHATPPRKVPTDLKIVEYAAYPKKEGQKEEEGKEKDDSALKRGLKTYFRKRLLKSRRRLAFLIIFNLFMLAAIIILALSVWPRVSLSIKSSRISRDYRIVPIHLEQKKGTTTKDRATIPVARSADMNPRYTDYFY